MTDQVQRGAVQAFCAIAVAVSRSHTGLSPRLRLAFAMLRLLCRSAVLRPSLSLRPSLLVASAALADAGGAQQRSGRVVAVQRIGVDHARNTHNTAAHSLAAPSSPAPHSSPPPLPAHAAAWMDARAQRPNLHWTRRNARKSNVVLMGHITHKQDTHANNNSSRQTTQLRPLPPLCLLCA